MNNTQTLEYTYLELNEQSKRIQKMRFCIISCYGHIQSRNNLLNFTLDYHE